jgi:1-acyl-sn-glycerol-3-phosphate acyltransferase
MHWQPLGPALPAKDSRITRWLGRRVFQGMGWRIDGTFPNRSQLIVAVAPHSSNVDFVLAMAVVLGLGLHASFLAKRSLFKGPLRPLMNALGGIPVDRNAPQGLVGQMAEQFRARRQLVLGITPEGTRRGVDEWKRGFALIAKAANVPVLPATLDYRTKTVCFAPLITDVTDVDRTIAATRRAAENCAPRQPR